ncbi:MAG: DUF1801 domain-containing protein [Vitreimonas sp.]
MAKTVAAKKAAPKKDGSDWRVALLARVRALIKDADPDVEEEAKWKKASNPAGVPTWSHDGIICTGEKYKDKVKLTFAHGAKLADPARLFNAGLDGGTRRAIDFQEGDKLNEKAFKALIREAVVFNISKAAPKKAKRS